MTLRQSKRSITAKHTVHRHINARHCLANHLLMRIAAEAVDENSRKIQLRIIDTKAERRRRRRCSDGLCVDDEEDGSVQCLCYRGCRTDTAPPAVIESHDALDDGDVRARTFACKDLRQPCLRHKPCIQIMPGASARQTMVTEVDIVRSHLERLHRKTARAERGKKPRNERCLAAARLRCRYDNARDIPLHEFSP